jgi:hypothetical protein
MPTLPVTWFEWIELNAPGSAWMRESVYGFAILLTVHVVAMCLFFGLILMMDLRLAGLGHKSIPPEDMQRRLFPWQISGFVAVAISGFLLFYSKPLTYYGKGFFWTKLALMGLAGLNAGYIHVVTHRAGGRGWDSSAARFAGIMSIVLWAGVLITGRLVAYEWWTTEYIPGFITE